MERTVRVILTLPNAKSNQITTTCLRPQRMTGKLFCSYMGTKFTYRGGGSETKPTPFTATSFFRTHSKKHAPSNKPFTEKLKHAAIQFFFIRENIRHNNIKVKYIESAKNLADIFTKPLKPEAFISIRDQLVHHCN